MKSFVCINEGVGNSLVIDMVGGTKLGLVKIAVFVNRLRISYTVVEGGIASLSWKNNDGLAIFLWNHLTWLTINVPILLPPSRSTKSAIPSRSPTTETHTSQPTYAPQGINATLWSLSVAKATPSMSTYSRSGFGPANATPKPGSSMTSPSSRLNASA